MVLMKAAQTATPEQFAGCNMLGMSRERSELSATVPSNSSTTGVYSFYLAGQWLTSSQVADVISPYDQRVVGRVSLAGPEHVERAIDAAVRSFAVTRKLAAYERQQALAKISAELTARAEEFAQCISAEAGKPIRTARGEVARACFTFQYAAEEATRSTGELLPLDAQPSSAGRIGLLRRFPRGPVSAITPFNFPLNLVAHKIAPALAAGCSMVLKPAPQTPMVALMLADVIARSGYPPEAVSILPMSNETAAPLIEDERFKLFSFTGSAAAGWALKSRAGKKKVVLELGGNAGCIVHADADLEHAVARCTAGGFSYAGQSCISVQRILVERSVCEAFTAKLTAAAQKLRTGDPSDERVDVGPMIRQDDAVRATQWIAEAAAEGAKVLCGGTRSGSLLAPTVLTATKETQRVNCQEIFAPVVTVEPYDDFGEAIASVNRSRYGLQAGVFTRDIERLRRAFDELEVGAVIANDIPGFRIDHMPYGGVKDSGQGREGIRYAMEEMTEPRLLVIA
jgi:acyl-CoA reductase-like NAD-dependent aldehyde dehydrogenase